MNLKGDLFLIEIQNKIKTIEGIENIFRLDDIKKNRILELEKEANGKVLMGMGIGDNQGIKVAFTKKYLFVVITNKKYKWPQPPNVIMKQNETIIGFDCTKEEVEKYKNSKDYTVFGTFVMNRKNVPNSSGKPIVILPSKKFEVLNEMIPGIDAVIASPSTPSDEYINSVFNIKKVNGNGTIIIGFDDF